MKVAVTGAGKVGRFIARDLTDRGHDVVLIEQNHTVIEKYGATIDCEWLRADACEPLDLKKHGLEKCDILVAATGDDEDNIVTSLLAKQEFGIPRVLARVNHPNNHWLFNESWGVDVAVSPPQLLTSLVEEAVTTGDIVRILTLEGGGVTLVEFTLDESSPAVGKVISELELPIDCAIVAIVRNKHVIVPRGETPLMVGDEVVALASPDQEGELECVLSGRSGGSDGKFG